jgi:hypothetical protein
VKVKPETEVIEANTEDRVNAWSRASQDSQQVWLAQKVWSIQTGHAEAY